MIHWTLIVFVIGFAVFLWILRHLPDEQSPVVMVPVVMISPDQAHKQGCVGVLIVIVLLLMLSGCNNPLGATDRTQIRAQAYVQAAQAQADAQKAVAVQETVRTGMWASLALPALMILMGGAVVLVVVWWQGRIWLARVERAPAPPDRKLSELRRLAAAQGYRLEVAGPVAYLVDASGRRVGQRLLTD